MKPWKDLSMAERSAFIKTGVKNGIKTVNGIRDAYNKSACGGYKFDDGGYKKDVSDVMDIAREEDDTMMPQSLDGITVVAHHTGDMSKQKLYKGEEGVYRNPEYGEKINKEIDRQWRNRFGKSKAQQQRQAQMSSEAQYDRFNEAKEDLSEEDKKYLANEEKFREIVAGTTGLIMTAPITVPLIASGVTSLGLTAEEVAMNIAKQGLKGYLLDLLGKGVKKLDKSLVQWAVGAGLLTAADVAAQNKTNYLNTAIEIGDDAGWLTFVPNKYMKQIGMAGDTMSLTGHGVKTGINLFEGRVKPAIDEAVQGALSYIGGATNKLTGLFTKSAKVRKIAGNSADIGVRGNTAYGHYGQLFQSPQLDPNAGLMQNPDGTISAYQPAYVDSNAPLFMNFAKGGRLAHKFDGTSEPTQRLYQNSQGNLLSQDQYDELVWRAKNNADIAAVNDYKAVQVPVRQQQPINDRMFEGNLNEITVRPDITYNSDVRNIPALETTEEPLSDEIRRRYATSVGQQRRQAQMTPAEQWANYYNNLFNLSYEDRKALENDRKFKRFIGGVAGGTMLGAGAIAAAADLGPPVASWAAKKAIPWITERLLPKYLNPGWLADQTVSGLGKWATRRGYTALASGLEDIAGVEGVQLFGASSLPGTIINGTLGMKFGYDALNSFIQTPPWSPDRTVGQTFWDTLGLMGGAGTMMESAPYISTIPGAIANKLRPFKMIGDYTGEKELFKQEYGEKLGNFLFKQKKKLDYRRLDQAIKRAQEYETTRNTPIEKAKRRISSNISWLNKDVRRLPNPAYDNAANVKGEDFKFGIPNSLTVQKGKARPEKHGTSSILFSKASPENQVKYLNKYLGFYLKDHPNSPLADYEVKIVNGKTAIVPKSATSDVTTTIEKGEIPIWGKDINKESVSYELETHTPTDNGVYFLTGETLNQLSDGFTKKIPEEAINALLKFQTEVSKTLKGIPMGSSVLVTNGVPLNVHDIDLVALDYLADQNEVLAQVRLGGRTGVTKTIKIGVDGEAGKVGFRHEKGMYTGSNPSEHDFSSVDVNYILTEEGNDGKRHLLSGLKKVPIYNSNHNQVGSAVVHNNPIAETLYKMYYPEEYQQQLQDIVLHMDKNDWPGARGETLSSFGVPFKRFDENGNLIELSPEELLQNLKEDPMVYTIWNSLDTAYWLPHKDKHLSRIFDIIQYGNSQSVARGLRTWATTKLGGDRNYIAPPNFAEMGFFNDPVKNKWLLKQMGYKFDVSNDPQRMQNAFEAYYNDATILYRGIGVGPNNTSGGVEAFVPDAFDSPENLLKALKASINEWNGGSGGTGNGVGTNAVKGSNTYGELGFYFMLPSELDEANSIEDAWRILQKNTGNGYKLTQADLDAMPTVAKVQDVKVGTDSQQLLDAITNEWRDRQGRSLDFYKEIDAELHANGMYALSRTPDRSDYVQGATYVTVGNGSAGDRFAMAAKRAQFDPDFLASTKLGDIQIPLDRRMADYFQESDALKELGITASSTLTGPAKNWNTFYPGYTYGETWDVYENTIIKPSKEAQTILDLLKGAIGASANVRTDFDYFKKYLLGAGQYDSKEHVLQYLEKAKTMPSKFNHFSSIYETVVDALMYQSGKSKEEIEKGIMDAVEYMNKLYMYEQPFGSNRTYTDYLNRSNIAAVARNSILIDENYRRLDKADQALFITDRRASRLHSKASYRKAVIKNRAKTAGGIALAGAGIATVGYALDEHEKHVQREHINRRINRASTSIDECQNNLRDAYLSGKIDANEYREYMDKLNQYRTQIIGGYLDNGTVDRDGMADLKYDIIDIQHRIKSYGGSLELNDQYGIGKYINY